MSGRPAPAPRSKLPAPTHQCLDGGQTRESAEIPRHWLLQLPAVFAAPVTSYTAQFRTAHRLPHEVSPLCCPVPPPRASCSLQSTMPCVLVVHRFTIPLAPSSWSLSRGGTDMPDQDGPWFQRLDAHHTTSPAVMLMPCDGRHNHGSYSGLLTRTFRACSEFPSLEDPVTWVWQFSLFKPQPKPDPLSAHQAQSWMPLASTRCPV